jgi:hypothetical protein
MIHAMQEDPGVCAARFQVAFILPHSEGSSRPVDAIRPGDIDAQEKT